jgi:hypothetical protein
MQATGEDLHGAIVALTVLVGVMLASDPRREELVEAYEKTLKLLDQHPEWQSAALRAREYGASIVNSFRMPGPIPQRS